jgi:peroxiredoxin Q/BCP
MTMNLKKGSKAPVFFGVDDQGNPITLSDHAGKKLVLYFYPKDSTPGCSIEANDFRERLKDFEALGASVIGVSRDSVRRHANFKKKQKINFPLISDETGAICNSYGVWQEKQNYGRTYMGIVRTTFLISETGEILEIWPNVRVKGHAERVLESLSNL